MKRQKVFYDITQEHPAEIYRLEEYSAFVIRKDSEGVFLYIYFKEKEEGLFYEWNINDDHCHCCAWWSISSLWSLSVGHFLRTVQYMPVCFAPCS